MLKVATVFLKLSFPRLDFYLGKGLSTRNCESSYCNVTWMFQLSSMLIGIHLRKLGESRCRNFHFINNLHAKFTYKLNLYFLSRKKNAILVVWNKTLTRISFFFHHRLVFRKKLESPRMVLTEFCSDSISFDASFERHDHYDRFIKYGWFTRSRLLVRLTPFVNLI